MYRECPQHNQCGERCYVKDYMKCIEPDAIADRQEGVRFAKHDLIARYALGVRTKEIWNPPRLQFADEQKGIADPEPPKQLVWIGSAEVYSAGGESNRKWNDANESGSEKLAPQVRRVNSPHVIECSERNPIVEG